MDSQFTNKEVVISAQLPHDFITEILIRLPVKSLLCFKCVSKSFCAFIESKYFIDSHLNKSNEDKSHLNLLFPMSEKITTNCNSAKFEVSSLAFRRHVHGYCNGIFLLLRGGNHLVLWNPSTQQQRILPNFPGREKLDSPNRVRIGLGYDSSRDDHKVVVIEPIPSHDPLDIVEYQVWIFGFRSFSWRRVYTDFHARANARNDVSYFGYFAHGNLHWLFVNETVSYDLVSFDMAKETLSMLAKPNNYNITDGPIPVLNVLGGWLCMSSCPYIRKPEGLLYVRKKDGAEFVWSLLYSITKDQFPAFVLLGNSAILGYSSERDKIMLDLGVKCVVSLDMKEKSFQLTDIEIPTDFFFPARRFVESLVSVAPNKPFVKLFSS